MSFTASAARLAGLAGLWFGWTPEVFWNSTPAELAALVRVPEGEGAVAVAREELVRWMERFPDG